VPLLASELPYPVRCTPRRLQAVRAAFSRCGSSASGCACGSARLFRVGAASDGAGRGRRSFRLAVGVCAMAPAARALQRLAGAGWARLARGSWRPLPKETFADGCGAGVLGSARRRGRGVQASGERLACVHWLARRARRCAVARRRPSGARGRSSWRRSWECFAWRSDVGRCHDKLALTYDCCVCRLQGARELACSVRRCGTRCATAPPTSGGSIEAAKKTFVATCAQLTDTTVAATLCHARQGQGWSQGLSH
jgi:hypothetical protein